MAWTTPGIAVEVVIDAPTSIVWSDIADLASHVEWMADAEAIRFLDGPTSGVGTRFECDTVVGPFRLVDIMHVTGWEPGRSMAVDHHGLVSGSGVFTLTASGSATVFSWVERLRFPWYFGGPLGALVARPVLRAVWRANLRRLKHRIETGSGRATLSR